MDAGQMPKYGNYNPPEIPSQTYVDMEHDDLGRKCGYIRGCHLDQIHSKDKPSKRQKKKKEKNGHQQLQKNNNNFIPPPKWIPSNQCANSISTQQCHRGN
jgi:hypothetical protein